MKIKKIDVHHHITPDFYVEKLKSIGIEESYGQDFPKWTPETSLKIMKKMGIKISILSISTPGVSLSDEIFSKELASQCNEYMAEVKKKYPDNFGGFASIPLPYVQGAIDELRYALDVLKLDGVCLYTHYEGKYLGDKEFDVFFKELNKRKTVVYIHPTDPIGQYDPKLEVANSLIEAPFETTRAVTNLIHSGTLDRFPDIKLILSHGGGAIPFLAWRVALSNYSNKEARPSVLRMIYDWVVKGGPESGLKLLKNMYYDTALSTSPYALKAMQELAGSSHIVFGSDLPFAEKVAPIVAKDLITFKGFTKEDIEAIEYKNCLSLFPSLKGPSKNF
jgi:predicted TIM-barrel fold metal-dependent hydrolase